MNKVAIFRSNRLREVEATAKVLRLQCFDFGYCVAEVAEIRNPFIMTLDVSYDNVLKIFQHYEELIKKGIVKDKEVEFVEVNPRYIMCEEDTPQISEYTRYCNMEEEDAYIVEVDGVKIVFYPRVD